MKIRARCEKKCSFKHYDCTRMVFSTGRRARDIYRPIVYVYYVYSICIQVELLLLSLLLLS